MTAPEPGDAAPDVALLDQDGKDVALSAYWTEQPALVVFLRHWG